VAQGLCLRSKPGQPGPPTPPTSHRSAITPKTDNYDYTARISAKLHQQDWAAHRQHPQRRPHRSRLPDGPGPTYAGSADFYGKYHKDPDEPARTTSTPNTNVLSSGNGASRVPRSSRSTTRSASGRDDDRGDDVHGCGTDFGGGSSPELHTHDADGLERGPVRLREALPVLAQHSRGQGRGDHGVSHVVKRAQEFGLQFPGEREPWASRSDRHCRSPSRRSGLRLRRSRERRSARPANMICP